MLDVKRGKSYIPGIAARFRAATSARWSTPPPATSPARCGRPTSRSRRRRANTSTSGCEAGRLRRHAEGRDRAGPARRLRRADKWLNARGRRRGRDRPLQRGRPASRTRRRSCSTWRAPGITIPIVGRAVATVRGPRRQRRAGPCRQDRTAAGGVAVGPTPTENVIAETRGGDPNKVIVVGAHLDSVGTGPGINDNGSGSAAILEFARAAARREPEEQDPLRLVQRRGVGLLGSEAYVASLPRDRAGQDRGEPELRHDRLAELRATSSMTATCPTRRRSPRTCSLRRPGRSRRRSRRSSWTTSSPSGSRRRRRTSTAAPTTARSSRNGIPAGGLFTGAEGIKTPAQAALFGGTAGEQYDPCYHLGCDNFFNNSNRALDQNSDAAAHALITLAQSKIPDRPAVTPAPAARRRSATVTDNQQYIDRITPLG